MVHRTINQPERVGQERVKFAPQEIRCSRPNALAQQQAKRGRIKETSKFETWGASVVALRENTCQGADMSGWENFFGGELGASAALAGLVLVGVSVNLTKIMHLPHLPNRALEALVPLVAVLFISSLLLIPGQALLAIGIEVLLIGLIDWMTVGFLQLKILRQLPARDRRTFVRSIVVFQMAALCFVIAGIVLLIFGSSGLYWVAAASLLSFLAAFIEAWVLLIEINR
jgi:hypothetical protein